tara:strand:- start:3634 stop:3978 length:345 start_codon:yes stop_codon:yes gene_type:complete
VRIKRGTAIKIRHRQVLDLATGFKGGSSRLFRVANIQVMVSLARCRTGRRQHSSLLRQVCLCRINNALHRYFEVSFYFFRYKCKENFILLNLKMINLIIILDKAGFKKMLHICI